MQVEPETIRLASPTKQSAYFFSLRLFFLLFFFFLSLYLSLYPPFVLVLLLFVLLVLLLFVLLLLLLLLFALLLRNIIPAFQSRWCLPFFFGFVKRYAAISQAKRSKPKF